MTATAVMPTAALETQHDPTEDGLALILTAKYSDTLRYCAEWGLWMA